MQCRNFQILTWIRNVKWLSTDVLPFLFSLELYSFMLEEFFIQTKDHTLMQADTAAYCMIHK